MKNCDVCGKEATWKCYGGTPLEQPGAWTDAVPFDENHVFRCEKHQNIPAWFGKLWKWYPKNERYAHLFK